MAVDLSVALLFPPESLPFPNMDSLPPRSSAPPTKLFTKRRPGGETASWSASGPQHTLTFFLSYPEHLSEQAHQRPQQGRGKVWWLLPSEPASVGAGSAVFPPADKS